MFKSDHYILEQGIVKQEIGGGVALVQECLLINGSQQQFAIKIKSSYETQSKTTVREHVAHEMPAIVLANQNTRQLDALLVSNIISRFVEPVRLFPASVKAHGRFVLQQLVNAACSVGWSTSETLLLRITNWRESWKV